MTKANRRLERGKKDDGCLGGWVKGRMKDGRNIKRKMKTETDTEGKENNYRIFN
jgi:hypothetical protein